ncbi:MAG: response regulator [Draconibacterium sp.]
MKKLKGLDCILLVDDDEVSNYLNTILIEKTGIDVQIEITLNGLMALEYLTCSGRYKDKPGYPRPGLVLLDINMPGMNGWEFLNAYNSLDENQKGNVTIAMLTSSNNIDDVNNAMHNYGIPDYIYKPLTLPKIQEVIYKHFPGEE